MWNNVNGSNGPQRRGLNGEQCCLACRRAGGAVHVDELRVRADRAGAGHAVRLQERRTCRAPVEIYSGTWQSSATAKSAQYRRGNAPAPTMRCAWFTGVSHSPVARLSEFLVERNVF